jgi:intracellular sulfur oxidation DsrE/DsrF family protein
MTSNQELLEMVQALEQKVVEQQRKIAALENDLDDADNRLNRLIQKMVTTTMFNNSMEIQKKFGLNDIRGRL